MPPHLLELDRSVRAVMDQPDDLDALERLLALYREAPDGPEERRRVLAEKLARGAPYPFVTAPERVAFRNNLRMPPPWRVARPTSTRALYAAAEDALRALRPMRALGGGWGFSNIAETNGLVLDLAALDAVVPLDAATLAPGVDPDGLVYFQAGATIEALTRHLAGRGRALLNQPGFEKLSFVGTAACGGHGSGIGLGPLSDQVRALDLLTVDGRGRLQTLRIESKTAPLSRPGARWPGVDALVQDDTVFRACTVSLGALGVIVRAVIETQPFFYLREDRALYAWSELRPRLDAIVRDPSAHSVHVWVNPYQVGGERHAVLSRYTRHPGPRSGTRPGSYALGGVQALADLFVLIANHLPEALPGLLLVALRATVASGVVMPCDEALNFSAPNHLRVIAAAAGVDAGQACAAVDAFGEMADRAMRSGRPCTSPVGLRWVRAADGLLSPQRGRATCMMEVPLLEGTRDPEVTLTEYLGLMCDRFGARPHWGQYNPMSPSRLKALYAETWGEFAAVFRAFNPLGLWDNAFTRQVGLSA